VYFRVKNAVNKFYDLCPIVIFIHLIYFNSIFLFGIEHKIIIVSLIKIIIRLDILCEKKNVNHQLFHVHFTICFLSARLRLRDIFKLRVK
jgi:hypothetical protein